MQCDLDVLLFEPRDFGDDPHMIVSLADLDMWPTTRPAPGQHRQVEAAREVIEDAVHFAVQRQERIGILARRRSRQVSVATPRDQISHAHSHIRLHSIAQAACFCSIANGSLPVAIAIRRGFISSGSSRTSSTVRTPFSNLAPVTVT